MSQYLLCADPNCASCNHAIPHQSPPREAPPEAPYEPFSVVAASGRRVSILNPDTLGPPPSIADRSVMPSPSNNLVRITKTFRCSLCPKVFTTNGHLQRHCRVHAEEKQYTCPSPDCNKQCNRQDNLLQHYKIHLPRSERKRGPEYLTNAFNEMVAKRAATLASQGQARAQAQQPPSISPASSSASVKSPSAQPKSIDTSSLQILAASAVEVAWSIHSSGSDTGRARS